jgi:hypothetical protein
MRADINDSPGDARLSVDVRKPFAHGAKIKTQNTPPREAAGWFMKHMTPAGDRISNQQEAHDRSRKFMSG